MKGSPILATITAITVMLSIFIFMGLSLDQEHSNSNLVTERSANPTSDLRPMTSAYIEAHFSSPPSSFSITHPVSNKTIIQLKNITDNEWSGQIEIPIDLSVELNIQATWEKVNSPNQDHQHFIQLILSPDEWDDASATLRSEDDIDTTATFTWSLK